ncbi:MAG: tRNA-dihydrouridine synthase family protein [Spirochaetia bacterium]|nr:tRNA-dihydrouridine synthase family protein [Spirochaetia bacterium]
MAYTLPADALALAPMVGLSHRALRTLVEEFGGCDLHYTEMSSAPGYISGAPYDAWFLDAQPAPERTVLQFYGPDAPRLGEAVARSNALPALGVDVNFGCSAPHIVASGGGVAWMKDPAGAAELVKAARANLAPGRTLSAKTRAGYEDDYGKLLEFARALEEAGLDWLVLHPRTKAQKFKRAPKRELARRLGEDLGIPVLLNGDVRRFEDWIHAREAYAPAGVMLGREAVRRPWVFALFRGLERDAGFELEAELEATALRFLDLVEAHLPPEFHETRAKRFFHYYCDNVRFAHHFRTAVMNAPGIAGVREAVKAYFREVPADRVKLEKS